MHIRKLSAIVLIAILYYGTGGCATDSLEINPDLKPGQSVGVDIKSCFSEKSTDSKWGLGIPKLWNAINGCKAPEEEE